MKISLNWIQDYLNTTLPLNKLESGLTSLGLECTLESNRLTFSGVVIGDIIECKPHPNADKLYVLKINTGRGKRQICAGIKIQSCACGWE